MKIWLIMIVLSWADGGTTNRYMADGHLYLSKESCMASPGFAWASKFYQQRNKTEGSNHDVACVYETPVR